MAAREEEATRIARELHDELGQSLTSVLLGLKGLEAIEEIGEIRRRIADLAWSRQRPVEEIHRLIQDLRPASLDRVGLLAALALHAWKRAPQSRDCGVDFCAPGSRPGTVLARPDHGHLSHCPGSANESTSSSTRKGRRRPRVSC